MLMYSLGDFVQKMHSINSSAIEGDPDHPVSRGSLIQKRGGSIVTLLIVLIGLKYPEYRAPGSNKWVRISWEEAISRIARLS